MNVLMLTLLYPDDQLKEAQANAKDKIQNQINSYQRAFEKGIRKNLKAGEKLSIINSLPVGIYPLQYKKLILKSGLHDNGTIEQLGCINLPWLKQQMRTLAAAKAIHRWTKQSPENRTLLVYTQYLPYLKAILHVKKKVQDLKAAVIVTDLPNEYGLPSGRTGILKKLEERMGRNSLELCAKMDGFVLLTEPMAEVIGVQNKPYTVIEGLILEKALASVDESVPFPETSKPVVLYTGTLEPGLGIQEMLDACKEMPGAELWICGQGSMKETVESAASSHENIRYFGFVPQKEALALQARADALINPRQAGELFTRYSFPSKTLEYMRSGKPVLCCRLEGIPADYDSYLCYMDSGKEGIVRAIEQLMSLSPDQRRKMGESARSFVLSHKNPDVQCAKVLELLRRLSVRHSS